MRGTYLYRPWGHTGTLLYVGVTNDLRRRMREHELESLWWPQVRNVTWEMWPTRTEALWAEWVAIVTEKPLNNRHLAGTPLPLPRPTTPLARLAFRAAMALGHWPTPQPATR